LHFLRRNILTIPSKSTPTVPASGTTVTAYAPATLYIEINTVKQAIKWLIGEGLLPKSAKITLAVKKPGDNDAFCYTPDQVDAILEQAFGDPELLWLGNALVGLVYTGLRIGELAQIRWPAIDLDKKVMRIIDNRGSTAKADDLVEMSTKTHRSRSLPIHPELLKVLERIPRHADGRVFHGPCGGILKPDIVRRTLIDSVTPLKSKFPGQPGFRGFADGRLHTFRHFFCSKCAADGVPEQVVMRWLGHTTSRMVQHYYHLHDEESQRQMSKLTSVGGPNTLL
jgi:integrase